MGTAGLMESGVKFRALQESLTGETLDLCDDDIFASSVFEEIVGSSKAICRVTEQVMRVAPSDAGRVDPGRFSQK